MFSDAINIAKQFTQGVVICRRTAKGVCSSSIGSFVVVNDDGWIVTAGHILKHIFQLSAEAQAARDHETKVAAIRGDSNLTPKERSKQLSALGRVKNDSTDRFCVIWGQFPGVQLHDAVALNAVDLAIGRLEPFDKNVIKSYPTFKDPSKNFEPGMSLCKLGFPFHHIAPTYNSANDQFVLPPEAFPMPLFPMGGIFTRIQLFNPPAGVAGPSYRCLKNWVADRLIPYIKFQRTVLFDPEKVEAALRQRERGVKRSTSCRSTKRTKREGGNNER